MVFHLDPLNIALGAGLAGLAFIGLGAAIIYFGHRAVMRALSW